VRLNLVGALRREGVLGINRRNHEYTLRWNPRRLYPTVDDKLATKRLCQAAGIPIPGLIAVARRQGEVRGLVAELEDLSHFVLKPAHGAMGNGILVVRSHEGGRWQRAGGRPLTAEDLRYHAASIISGLYALGGQPDVAFVEELLEVHPELAAISADGVPDVRVIVHRGIPIMSMTRLPTKASRGRANLHQGAIGAGVQLATGRILHAVLDGTPVTRHPDTDQPVVGRSVPSFARVLEIAVAATDETGLGYVGADVVVDARRGPVVLELNARPGLAIQAANRAGLLPRLRAVSERARPGAPLAERIALGIEIASSPRVEEAV
jgi:alpha-L-glutamate ligase-like protein